MLPSHRLAVHTSHTLMSHGITEAGDAEVMCGDTIYTWHLDDRFSVIQSEGEERLTIDFHVQDFSRQYGRQYNIRTEKAQKVARGKLDDMASFILNCIEKGPLS